MLLHIANKELQVNRMKRLRSIFIVLIATFVLVAILSFGQVGIVGRDKLTAIDRRWIVDISETKRSSTAKLESQRSRNISLIGTQ